jgi:hypothetical protein
MKFPVREYADGFLGQIVVQPDDHHHFHRFGTKDRFAVRGERAAFLSVGA